MHRINALASAVVVAFLMIGCDNPKSGRGFTLPDGNVERGQTAFVKLRCHECHSVSGVELPKVEGARESLIPLGGKVGQISTYGQLVTSIINPSHKLARGIAKKDVTKDGESQMRNYNDVMTIAELIDLVAFLQSHYELLPHEPTPYPLLN
jgi:hypothetical protein